MNKKKVLFLLGPTGVGKSELAVKIAEKFNMEIISADSVQVYKGFDIGSAKISQKDMKGIKHYGIDILSPEQCFSAGNFVDYTKKVIEEIHEKGKIPLIVGGTGLYVKSLVEGYNFGDTFRHDDFRAEMEKLAEKEGLNSLFEKLQKLAPEVAEKIDKQNKIRLIRALEIATFGTSKTKCESEYDFLCFGLTMPREMLYQNINKRTEIMVEQGLIEETKFLYEKYGDCPPMGAIGYKETLAYIKGEFDKTQMVASISQHTRNYAKRQLTFLRGLEYLQIFNKTDDDYLTKMEKEIEKWMH